MGRSQLFWRLFFFFFFWEQASLEYLLQEMRSCLEVIIVVTFTVACFTNRGNVPRDSLCG